MNDELKKNGRMETWLAGGLIIVVAALTYGILIPQLGFYRDDWYMLWAGQSPGGLTAITRLFLTDRPLIGWVYALIFKFIGTNVLWWQLFGLVLKILTGLSALWLLRLIWPGKRLETLSAALLFVLYPGFYQQPVAATFCIDLLGLNAIICSMALTVLAVKTTNRVLKVLYILAAMLLGLVNLGLYEATIGLEVVRWALVWWMTHEGGQNQPQPVNPESPTKKTTILSSVRPLWNNPGSRTGWNNPGFRTGLLALSPYLLMLAGFLYWRLFIFTSVRRATSVSVLLSDYASNPLLSFVQILIGYLKDLFETIVLAWFVPFYQFTAGGRFNNFILALGVAVGVLILIGGYAFWYRRHATELMGTFHLASETSGADLRSFVWIGLIGVLIPSAVIDLLGRNVLFSNQWDRYTTQSMLGVAVLVSGCIFYFLRAPARWPVIMGLVFLAVMTQVHSAAEYARFWDYERGLVWQLSWRTPGFQPGTTLIVSLPEGYHLAEEYEIWGPVNMAFYPAQPMQVTGQVPTDRTVLDLKDKTLDKRSLRNINVRRDYGKPLIISMPSVNSCFHVLDGQHPALPFFEGSQIKDIASYSNIKLLDLSARPVQPAASIFGEEPPHSWCYYYQQIELALQSGKFGAASTLADKAIQEGLKASDQTEWLAIVEAYASTNQIDKLNTAAGQIDKDLRKSICLQQAQITLTTQTPYAGLVHAALCIGG